jgi:hypothetical protein
MRIDRRVVTGGPVVAGLACCRLDVFRFVFVVCLSFMLGCQTPQATTRPEAAQDVVVQDQGQLKERLDDFVQFFQSTIEAAAGDIERKSPAKESRQAAALWRVRMVSECKATVAQNDPREVLLDLWTLCVRMNDYLTKGEGKAVFGPSQSLAVAASDKIDEALDRLVQQYVSQESLPKVRDRITGYSSTHPIRGEFVVAPSERLSDNPEVEKALGDLINLPLAPLRALGAIGNTPESVRDVSKSVYRFSDVLEDLPASARWQLQLLGMNLDESATVSTTVGSFKKLSDSSVQVADNSSRFVQVIDDMPAKVRKEADVLLKTVDESQPQVQATLKEAQKTATTVQTASQDIRETVGGVDRTVVNVRESAVALEQAANAVTLTAKEVLKFIPSSMKDETGQIIDNQSGGQESQPASNSGASTQKADAPATDTSFSFQAVTESADSLGATTEKLRGLLGELRTFVDGGSLSAGSSAVTGQMRGAVDFSAVRLREVVDHAAKRSAQLLLLAFVLVVVYQVGIARFTRPRKSQ